MRIFGIILIAALMCTACSDGGGPMGDDFDRTAMLANLGDHVIVPGYEAAVVSADALRTATDNFISIPDGATLDALRIAFIGMYQSWQDIGLFEFGPADNEALRSNINTYPTNTANIHSLIVSGNFNPDAIANLDSKGLPALDYLLYGVAGDDPSILALYTTDPDAAKYKAFLDAVVDDLQERITAVRDAWVNGYAATFKSSTGNSIGSSTGLLLNAYIFHYERPFRMLKLGLPLGVFSLEGEIFPGEAEALYSGISTSLIRRNFEQFYKVYHGIDDLGMNREGIDDYLVGVGAEALAQQIATQFDALDEKIWLLESPLTQQLDEDRATVKSVYDEIQKMVPIFKADMTSALSIQITYTDNDGD